MSRLTLRRGRRRRPAPNRALTATPRHAQGPSPSHNELLAPPKHRKLDGIPAGQRAISAGRLGVGSEKAAPDPPEAQPCKAEGEGGVDPGLVPLERARSGWRAGRSAAVGSRAA